MSIKQRRVLWPALLVGPILITVIWFVSARTAKSPTSPAAASSQLTKSVSTIPQGPISPTAVASPVPGPGPRRVVHFTLYDAGIYPQEVRVDKGLVAITIEDLSGGTDGLVVAPEVGSDRVRLGLVQRFERHFRGRSELAMTPGRYVVFDSSRPSNRAKLIVEP